jgi:hypothetical protein
MVALLIPENMQKFGDGIEANLNPFFRYTILMKWM